MADAADPIDPVPTPPVPPQPAPRRKRRWLRRALLLLVVLAVGLVVLVALAPTLLSTSPVVAFALRQVNGRLNGHVTVKDVSLGWTTGVKLDGVQVFDDAGASIAQVDHLTCPMPLWRAATGSYPLGHTVIDGLAFDAKYDAQGRLNFARLVKSEPTKPATEAKPKPSAPSTPSKLPNVSGDVELTNGRGTVSQPGKPTVFLTKLAGEVKIPDVNSPVTDHVDATVHVGDGGPEGHLVADGTASAVKGNRVDLDAANVHQTADVTGLDLAAAKPFVPASAGVDTLAGLVDAHLSADVTDGKSAVVDAAVTGKQKVVVGGRVLKGDTFSTDTFAAAIPKLSAAFPDGLGHWQSGRVKVGADDGSAPISFKVDQGQLTLVVDAVPQAVLNLAASKAPGSAGRVAYASHFDAGKIVAQLKNTAHLSGDATLTSGTLDQTLKLEMTPDKGTVTTTTDLANVAGSRNGQLVAIQPVHLALAATDVGTGKLLDALRDLSLTLKSKFANGDFHGTTVGDLTGTLTAQLQAMQAELGQLIDFGDTKLAGDLAVHLADSGQLMAAPYAAKVKADVSVTDLQYSDKTGPRVSEPLVRVDVSGDLHGSERSAVEQVKDLLVTIKAGTADAPSVDVAVAVPLAVLAGPAVDFQLTRLNVILPQVQRQFANVPAGQVGIVIPAGTLTGTAAGHYGADGIRLDPSKLSLANLTVQRQLPDNRRVAAVTGDTLTIALAGTVTLGDVKTIKLADLAIADSAKILDVHKGDGDLTVTKSKTSVSGGGQLAVMAELGSLNDILAVLTRTTVAVETPAGRVKSGHLSGTLAITAAADGKTAVNGTFDIPNLDVASATGDTGPQQASIVVRANADGPTVTADEVSFKSPFATVAVDNAVLSTAAKSTVDQLQKATLVVDVPDLKSAYALVQSFSTPEPAKPAAPGKPAEVATPPLVVMAGSMSLHADVSHDGNNLVLSVPTLTANNVAFTRGSVSYQAKPVTAKLAASVGTGDGKTLMAQLRGLKVTQLDANAGVATVTLTTPVTVADLSNPAAAAGGIKVDGELADLGKLAAAFAGKPADAYPYAGHLTLTQNLAGDASTVGVNGDVQIAKFQVLQGQQVQFAEDQLSVTDDVSMPADLSGATIRNLAVDFKSSQALNVSITNGRIDDLPGQRRLNVPVTYKYDLAKLWPIVHPMLLTPGKPDDYADVKVAGVFTRTLTAGGSYPGGKPFAEAVKPLQLDFGLAVQSFEHSGITVTNLDVPVTVRNGKAVTTDSAGNTAPVATANDGQLDLGHLTVDLTRTPPRLSTPANKAVLTNVTINPLFTKGILGKVVNNPVFVGAQEATGLISLSFDSCDRLPLGDLVKQNVPANDGSAHLKFSMAHVHIGVPGLSAIPGLSSSSFETQVNDGTVAVAKGVETQQIAFVSGPYTLGFNGSVRLADDAFVPMTMTVPVSAILAKQGSLDQNLKKYMPDTFPIALRGTASAPQFSFGDAAGQLVQQASVKAAQNGLGDLLNKQLNKGGGGNGANGGNNGNDPASILGGLFGGKKK